MKRSITASNLFGGSLQAESIDGKLDGQSNPQKGMTQVSLKYYQIERDRYPRHFRYMVNQDQAMDVVAACFAEFDLPAIPVLFSARGAPYFAFHWSYPNGEKTRIVYENINHIGNVLHEIAHYMDYLNRLSALTKLDPAYKNGWGPGLSDEIREVCTIIRKKHLHGPLHMAEMSKLVRWYDSKYGTPVAVDNQPAPMIAKPVPSRPFTPFVIRNRAA